MKLPFVSIFDNLLTLRITNSLMTVGVVSTLFVVLAIDISVFTVHLYISPMSNGCSPIDDAWIPAVNADAAMLAKNLSARVRLAAFISAVVMVFLLASISSMFSTRYAIHAAPATPNTLPLRSGSATYKSWLPAPVTRLCGS